MPKSVYKGSLAIFILLCLAGCASTQKKSEAAAALETKKKNYLALSEALHTDRLKKGEVTQEVKKEFGDPDETFHSGSNGGGSFEVWTYEKILAQDVPEKWELIRLYFNDGRLVDWKS